MSKKNPIFSKPEFQTFEEYKEWFLEFSNMLGAKGEISEEKMRKTWMKLKKAAEDESRDSSEGEGLA